MIEMGDDGTRSGLLPITEVFSKRWRDIQRELCKMSGAWRIEFTEMQASTLSML